MRVNYKHPSQVSRKDKKKKRLQQALREQKEGNVDKEMDGNDEQTKAKLEQKGLTSVQRKQIFKKHKAKDVKAQIADLRLQSKKLKKKNVAQKA